MVFLLVKVIIYFIIINMKKKRSSKKGIKKIEKDFVAWGNRKKVFYSITLATIILTLAGLPLILNDIIFLRRFLVIWILEVIYIGLWLKWGEN